MLVVMMMEMMAVRPPNYIALVMRSDAFKVQRRVFHTHLHDGYVGREMSGARFPKCSKTALLCCAALGSCYGTVQGAAAAAPRLLCACTPHVLSITRRGTSRCSSGTSSRG